MPSNRQEYRSLIQTGESNGPRWIEIAALSLRLAQEWGRGYTQASYCKALTLQLGLLLSLQHIQGSHSSGLFGTVPLIAATVCSRKLGLQQIWFAANKPATPDNVITGLNTSEHGAWALYTCTHSQDRRARQIGKTHSVGNYPDPALRGHVPVEVH